MLRFLAVRHLAVIDQLEVEFEPGLNLLTGETGAGKSVLVEAIDLLLGGRASADLVRTGEETATVQAVFERADGREIIIRRELSAQGRSRAFIDDTLATSAALRDVGRELVDLHGQHEHQLLLDPAEHLAYLDAYLANLALVGDVAARFDAWRNAMAALDRSKLDDREKQVRLEMAAFQLQEIDTVGPIDGEDAILAAERTVLANADRLTRLSSEAYAALYEGEAAALSTLGGVWKRVGELAALDARLVPYIEQRTALQSGLEDLAFFLRSYLATLETSPDRLEHVESRLASIERLKRKHGPALDDVLAKRRALEEEMNALGASEERVAMLESQEKNTRALFLGRAAELSAARRDAARNLARALELALAELAMPRSRVDLRVRPTEDLERWTRHGVDEFDFLLSPNPGEEPRPLARIASGGELSRIMLALRTLVTSADHARTLVFDEVDAGIGGAAADAVGARLQALGRHHQVLCITHLPQIAARGGAHFQISKQVRAGRTLTMLTRLDAAAREMEIARMIAGAEVSDQVRASARELLSSRGESEPKTKANVVPRQKPKGRSSAG